MNRNVWMAALMAILAPMMVSAAQKSEPAHLDIAEISREAALLVARYSAPSPQEFDLVKLGELADKQQELEKQEEREQAERTSAEKTPRSPQLKGQFEKFEKAVLSLMPLSLAAKEVTAH